MFWDQSLLGLFEKGGFAMWPLLVCSVVGFAIIAERGVYFAGLRFNYARFLHALKQHLAGGSLDAAQRYCHTHKHPVARLAAEYLNYLGDDGLREEALKRVGSYAIEQVETRLRVLAVLTHVAPLLGLLGTVTGLVSAFHQIELLGGQVQPSDLAAGIWEALITTVFGLVIAIPCMAAYHGFEGAADRIARQMQLLVAELNGVFNKHSRGRFTATDPQQAEAGLQAVL
jgi:biopolymer transport protein ExbB